MVLFYSGLRSTSPLGLGHKQFPRSLVRKGPVSISEIDGNFADILLD
jgi:hypothetical protein